jgi:hypothetical protein
LAAIANANKFLLELGAQLVPDTKAQPISNPDFTAAPAGADGVFSVMPNTDSSKEILTGVDNDGLDTFLPLIDDDANVIQLIFNAKSTAKGGKTSVRLGYTAAGAPNLKLKKPLKLTYRLGKARTWTTQTMSNFFADVGSNGDWGSYIFSVNGKTIAHEIGHVLGLAHRLTTGQAGQPGGDGVPPSELAELNIMSYEGNSGQKGDFDLIQAEAIQGSSAILPGT